MASFYQPLLGGAIIGLAVSIMLLFNGRITGVSGIISGSLRRPKGDFAWRALFLLGLLVGGFAIRLLYPDFLEIRLDRSPVVIAVAGILVGFGTVMGSGCTSGHGICGVSRMSPRSLTATFVFISFGALTATCFRLFFGEL